MKKALLAAAAIVALPVMAQAQTAAPGFYIGAEGGLNWLLNTTILGTTVTPQTGFAAGGVIGYDFVGPRVELEGMYRNNQTYAAPSRARRSTTRSARSSVMANLLYDFAPSSTITPYVGAGAGIAFVDGNSSLNSTQFAYQGIVGLGWNVDTNFRVNLDGRYYGTSNPSVNGSTWSNNNFTRHAGPDHQVRAGRAAAAAGRPRRLRRPRSWCSSTGIARTCRPAGAGRRSSRPPRPSRPRAAPASRRPATPIRRARRTTTWRCRCVVPMRSRTRWCVNGVPATAIAVVGRGEQGLLVPTPDGVREPQNRRVEIVLQ